MGQALLISLEILRMEKTRGISSKWDRTNDLAPNVSIVAMLA
jgi:hypothetical protein